METRPRVFQIDGWNFVLFFILEKFVKVPKYRYSEFGSSICVMIMTFFLSVFFVRSISIWDMFSFLFCLFSFCLSYVLL